MAMTPSESDRSDDPRRIRDYLARSCQLANAHGLPSMVVGFAVREGDLMADELLDFVESALRVEDSIFRMTRERAVLFLADVDRDQAAGIVRRLLDEFQARFALRMPAAVSLGYFEVTPGVDELPVRAVLPAVFPAPPEIN